MPLSEVNMTHPLIFSIELLENNECVKRMEKEFDSESDAIAWAREIYDQLNESQDCVLYKNYYGLVSEIVDF